MSQVESIANRDSKSTEKVLEIDPLGRRCRGGDEAKRSLQGIFSSSKASEAHGDAILIISPSPLPKSLFTDRPSPISFEN